MIIRNENVILSLAKILNLHLAIQLLWATARLLITCVRLIYVGDELFLFLLKLNKMRRLDESKIFIFLFLVRIKGMRESSESKISLCYPRSSEAFP